MVARKQRISSVTERIRSVKCTRRGSERTIRAGGRGDPVTDRAIHHTPVPGGPAAAAVSVRLQPALHRDDGQLGAVVDSELGQERGHVRLNGKGGDEQCLGDLRVGAPHNH